MRRTHLGVQAAFILSLVAFVSWPQFRPVHPQSIWRYAPNAVVEAETQDAARFAGDPAAAARASFAQNQTSYADATAGRSQGPQYYPTAAVAAAGGRLNALVGLARTSLNVPIPFARVLLRNIRTGQVFAQAVANKDGQFSFVDLDTSAYIVELLGPDGSVVATSSLVSLARGDVGQTVVRAPAAAQTIAATLGNRLTASAAQATTVAAGNDVTRTTTAESTPLSPR
jgi:hypothetical protein